MIAADQLADRHLARRHHPVEGGRDGGIAEVDLRALRTGLRLQYAGVRRVPVGAGLVEIGLGRDVLGLELLLAGEFGLGIDQRRLGALLRRLCLLQLNLVGLRLDHEQRCVLLHRRTILIFDLLDVTFHARHQFDGIDRGGIAGCLQIGREHLLRGEFHSHLRRRRRNEAVLLAARGQQDEHPCAGDERSSSTPRACRLGRLDAATRARPSRNGAREILDTPSHVHLSRSCSGDHHRPGNATADLDLEARA